MYGEPMGSNKSVTDIAMHNVHLLSLSRKKQYNVTQQTGIDSILSHDKEEVITTFLPKDLQ